MNLADPALLAPEHAEIDQPEIGETGGNHDACEPLGIDNATFVQLKAATFLVREKVFNFHAFAVPVTGFFDQV